MAPKHAVGCVIGVGMREVALCRRVEEVRVRSGVDGVSFVIWISKYTVVGIRRLCRV